MLKAPQNESVDVLSGFERSSPVPSCEPPARAELRRPFPRDPRSRLPLAIRAGFMDQDTFFQFYGRESTIIFASIFWALVKSSRFSFLLLSSLLYSLLACSVLYSSFLYCLPFNFFNCIFLPVLIAIILGLK